MTEKLCLFCEQPLSGTSRAKEDVLPKWLLAHLGLKKSDQIRGSHLTDVGPPVRPARVQGAHTILQGSVCETCNNQWLSCLETRVGPIIKALSLGNSLFTNRHDVVALSTWAFKTLALYNITSNYRPLVPLSGLRHIYREALPPPGCQIELAYLAGEPPSAFTTRMSPVKFLLLPSDSNKEDITTKVDQSSFVLTMQIGKLLLQVTGLPSFGIWARTDERRSDVLRIYPQIPESFDWPPNRSFDGSIDTLSTRVGLRLLFNSRN